MAQAAIDLNIKLSQATDHLPLDEAVLIPLYEGYRAATGAYLGIFNQPRCGGQAADILEDERERIDAALMAIGEKLKQLKSVKDFWRTSLLNTLADYEYSTGGGEKDILRTLAAAAALPTAKENTH